MTEACDYKYFRSVKGDGNCFYRSVGFAYLERLVLSEGNDRLQDLIYWVQKDYSYFNLEDPAFEQAGFDQSWRESKAILLSNLAALAELQ